MSNNNKLECDKIWQSLEDADIPKVWVQLLFSDTDRPATCWAKDVRSSYC